MSNLRSADIAGRGGAACGVRLRAVAGLAAGFRVDVLFEVGRLPFTDRAPGLAGVVLRGNPASKIRMSVRL